MTAAPLSPAPSTASARFPLWLIVLAAAVIAGIGMGLRQVMGLYLKPVTEHLGIGREAFSIAIAIANMVWGLASPFTGGVADRFGAGRVVVFGALSTAGGLYIIAVATSDVDLFISGILLGFGVAGAGVNAMVGAVGRAAPPEQRTQAISMLGIGSGCGMFLALPYAHLMNEQFGWQMSLTLLALTALTILLIAPIVGGRPAEQAGAARPQRLGEALAEAFRHPSFWMLTAGFFVCGFQVAYYALHLPAFLADRGLGGEVAVAALTMVGLGNLIGTWLAGQSARLFPKRLTLAFIYTGRALVFLCFLFLPITGPLVIALSFILGLLWLSTVPLTSSLVATFFGPVWMSMLFGIVFLSHQVGSFIGVWLAGWLYDTTRSYDLMWWISIALGLFAALVHWPIREEPVERLKAMRSPVPAE